MQLRWLTLPLLIGYALFAHAELGGTPLPAGNTAASAATSSSLNTHQQSTPYSVQETQLASGVLVREYIAPSGKVFAVAWEGPVMPDLQQVLGNYFNQYLDAANHSPASRGPLTINQTDLVVQSAGRMRAFFGRAYVPSLLPQGVAADVIQ